MRLTTLEVLGGYKYVKTISDELMKWTETFLLKSKHDDFSPFQSLLQSMVIPRGFRVEHLRVDICGE